MIDKEILRKFEQICDEFDVAATAVDHATTEMEELYSKSDTADRQVILMALADMKSSMARDTLKEIFATHIAPDADLAWIPEYVIPKLASIYEGLVFEDDGVFELHSDHLRHMLNVKDVLVTYLAGSGLSVDEMTTMIGSENPNCKPLILKAIGERIDYLWSNKS